MSLNWFVMNVSSDADIICFRFCHICVNFESWAMEMYSFKAGVCMQANF